MPDDRESRAAEWRSPATGRSRNRLQKLRALISPKTMLQACATEDHVLSVLASRRGREAALGRELFSDPAWDVLLELYAAKLGERRIALAELARSIDTPLSTTRRWVNALAERGLVASSPDPAEPARLWISLSAQGASAMKRLMDCWASAFRSI